MEQKRVTPLPARPTAEAAWTNYAKLATELRDNPERAASAAFCAETARAYRDWQRLFLASEDGI